MPRFDLCNRFREEREEGREGGEFLIRSVVKGIPRSPTREKLNGGWSEVASFNLKIPPGNYLRRVTIKSNFAASGNMKVHYCSSFHRGKENRG